MLVIQMGRLRFKETGTKERLFKMKQFKRGMKMKKPINNQKKSSAWVIILEMIKFVLYLITGGLT